MNKIESNEELKILIKENLMVSVYFGGDDCGVCTALKPKVKELLKEYDNIKSVEVDVNNNFDISAAYSIFTIPAILIFIEGKEIIREARHISVQDLNNKIERYYNMLF
jgi:thiol-disulfide isomerase/thioredoxin